MLDPYDYDDFEYEEDLEIDPDALDVEWLEQPRRFMKYCRAAREADRKAKRAHEKLKTVRSELVNKANEDPMTLLGIAKPTAQAVEAFYRTQQNYKDAKAEWVEAEHERDVLNDAVFAFQQRKMALENLVRLISLDYFKSPVEPRDLSKEALEKKKSASARDKIKSKMAGKTKRTK